MTAFKIIGNLTSDAKPVVGDKHVRVVSCKDFKGEISSITGIASKFLYIPKINQLTCETESPSIRIICGEECKTKCINLK